MKDWEAIVMGLLMAGFASLATCGATATRMEQLQEDVRQKEETIQVLQKEIRYVDAVVDTCLVSLYRTVD